MGGLLARLIGGAVSPLLDQVTSFGAGLLRKLALFLVAAVSMVVVVVASTLAFAFWISSLAGPVIGALAVAGLYLVVAIAAVVLALRRPRTPAKKGHDEPAVEDTADAARTNDQVDRFAAPLLAILQGLGLKREQLAVLAGASLAKQLNPLALVGVAIVAGFLVGRLWKGWDALVSGDLVETVLAMIMSDRSPDSGDQDGMDDATEIDRAA